MNYIQKMQPESFIEFDVSVASELDCNKGFMQFSLEKSISFHLVLFSTATQALLLPWVKVCGRVQMVSW